MSNENTIVEFPSSKGMEYLRRNFGPQPEGVTVDLMFALNELGLERACGQLRFFDYSEYCLFLADVVDTLKPFPGPEYDNVISAIREFKSCKISRDDLMEIRSTLKNVEITPTVIALFEASNCRGCSPHVVISNVLEEENTEGKLEELKALYVRHFGGKADIEAVIDDPEVVVYDGSPDDVNFPDLSEDNYHE